MLAVPVALVSRSIPLMLSNEALQNTQAWLKEDDFKADSESAQVGPMTPEKPGGAPWGAAKADAAWESPEKLQEQPELLDDYGYDDVLDDHSDFTVVESKKKKKGRQATGAGTAVRGARGRRRI